jgi:molecular chaperone DnaK
VPDAIIGIDLGTTNSVVATVINHQIEVIRDGKGRALHPSVVAFLPTGETVIGHRARARRVIDPLNTIFSAKRIIGRPYRDPTAQHVMGHLPYRVIEGENQEPLIQTRAGVSSVIDIAAMVLEYLRELAHAQLGVPVRHCVVTVPANFSDGQREATRRAAERAGMQVLRILNEPTAAALAYGHTRTHDRRVAVFDFGGGTFDLTLLSVHDGLYEVLATTGDPFLGGDDFDNAVADHLAIGFLQRHRVDLNAAPESRARLLQAAEEIKIELSSSQMAQGVVPDMAYGDGGRPLSLEFNLSRIDFGTLVDPFVSRAMALTEGLMRDAEIAPNAIDEVVLVGGTTLVPAVRERVARFFGKAPLTDVNPVQVVAAGAALQANALFAPPEEQGAAVGLLMDVTSHSLGIATAGGYTEFLIEKNTPIPAEGTRIFSTAQENQDMVRIRICQGHDKRFEENSVLGELRLSGLRAARRGEVQVEVTFLVDANGILQVAARDLQTGRDERATLSVLGLTDNAA